MLIFTEDYFQEEIRENFSVSAKMKRAWAAQLEVLCEIQKICGECGIRYFADWGTLLGAVRHHGFIPWDDDLDIGMLRDDYTKFLECAPPRLSAFFELKSLYSDPSHDNVKCRIITGRHMNFEPEYLKKFHGCPYVIGVDIFPIDYIPASPDLMKLQLESIEFVLSAAASLPDDAPVTEEQKALLRKIEHTFHVCIDRQNRTFHELKKLVDVLCAKYTAADSGEVSSMIDLAGGWDYHIPLECYADSIAMPFENTVIPVPIGYDKILRTKYGDDYMTPIRGGGSHDYPFYARQERALKETIEKEFRLPLSDDDFECLLSEKLAQSMR